jgi:hypothetical protein
MGPPVFFLLVLLAGGAISSFVALFSQVTGLKTRLTILEREREKDRELLEAVLLEDTAKLKRLLGTRD